MSRRQRPSSQATAIPQSPTKIARLCISKRSHVRSMVYPRSLTNQTTSTVVPNNNVQDALQEVASVSPMTNTSVQMQEDQEDWRSGGSQCCNNPSALGLEVGVFGSSRTSTIDRRQIDHCPIVDKDENVFPIMLLPTEIRLEIYRACLTRSYNLKLAKKERISGSRPTSEFDANGTSLRPELGESRRYRDHGSYSIEDSDPAVPSTLIPTASSSDLFAIHRTAVQPTLEPFNTVNGSNDLRSVGHGLDHMTVAPILQQPRERIADAQTTHDDYTAHAHASRASLDTRDRDLIPVNLLRANWTIYKEARSILYGENVFTLDLGSAISTLAGMHQRSRRLIKYVEVKIPNFNEILELFQETVRLSLRYCSGLKKVVVDLQFSLPGLDSSGSAGNATVYANGFDILRWLPQKCDVVLKGEVSAQVAMVVERHLELAKTLDSLAYARRQLIAHDGSLASSPKLRTPKSPL